MYAGLGKIHALMYLKTKHLQFVYFKCREKLLFVFQLRSLKYNYFKYYPYLYAGQQRVNFAQLFHMMWHFIRALDYWKFNIAHILKLQNFEQFKALK